MKNKREVKKEIGDFIVNETLRFVETGNSPVGGVGKFKKLNKKYADEQKGGNRTPNLELLGDMLDSLTYKQRKDGIEIGIFEAKQAGKAEGHNTGFEGHPTLSGKGLKRQFIPNEDQKYKQRIERGIKRIIKENTLDREVESPRIFADTSVGDEPAPTTISLQDIFSRDVIRDLLDGES